MQSILIIKTGALGDVLRTTSILPGLRSKHPQAAIEWVTARAAAQLVEGQPGVTRTHLVSPSSKEEIGALAQELARRTWDWVISLDDEQELCALATSLGAGRLSGAHLAADGQRAYTQDVAPWFDMGLLSTHGKQRADEMKVQNRRSHPEIYAEMLGIEMGHPELPVPAQAQTDSARISEEAEGRRPLIGLNTGAGGRWTSKQLPIERVVQLVLALERELGRELAFVVLGGRDEAARNAEILAALREQEQTSIVIDGGVENSLLQFAAMIDRLDLLVTSDSLALHVAVARRTPIVAFFAPTSAAEIELYGLGEKVQSESSDYCSYRPDADNSSITVERLQAAVQRVLASRSADS